MNADKLLPSLFLAGRPLSPIYSGLMRLRAILYQREIFAVRRLPVPVISIGNLMLGGTGKTPLVRYVAAYLQGRGRRPAIVSRGYGGSAGGEVNVVSNGRAMLLSAAEAGDEPRLLAEALPGVPVLTGAKRGLAGDYAVTSLGIDIIVLDDAFQHLGLARNLDLVLFHAATDLSRERVLPAGRLREPPSALERAHAFLVTGWDDRNREQAERLRDWLRSRFPGRPVFKGRHRAVEPLLCSRSGKTSKLSFQQGRKQPAFGFCGIARPDSFRETLIREKFNLLGFESFRDHYPFSLRDLSRIQRKARAAGAVALVTTEKDFVRLRHLQPLEMPVLALRVEMQPDTGFDRFLTERLST